MKAALVRIGVDGSYGKWNAPSDTCSKEFVYIPIPETGTFAPEMETHYSDFNTALAKFPLACNEGIAKGGMMLPTNIDGGNTHLDPDFEYLSYGDDGKNRGRKISDFKSGDLIVFYAGLKCIHTHKLVYAIIGIYVVDSVVKANQVSQRDYHKNAHTRKDNIYKNDIVVFANPEKSGRLKQYIEIGEYRNRAYRVKKNILEQWGGLTVKDGFIQRSGNPPLFEEADRFYDWFKR